MEPNSMFEMQRMYKLYAESAMARGQQPVPFPDWVKMGAPQPMQAQPKMPQQAVGGPTSDIARRLTEQQAVPQESVEAMRARMRAEAEARKIRATGGKVY